MTILYILHKYIKTWNYLEYVSVGELYNKYCFNNYLNFEIGTSKSIILFKTFYIRALTLMYDLEPMGTPKRLLHLVL